VLVALVKRDLLKVKARRASFSFTLDETSQGRIAVSLALGDEDAWCAAVPAKNRRQPAVAARSDRPGLFVAATRTPPPESCPL
jgi:hypothetical protein